MTRGPSKAVVRQLQTLFGPGTVAGMTDAQLLERFVAYPLRPETAELAFSALVARHGPMVLGVCRRVLRDSHAAQDAFQATFLVLVRKARTLTLNADLRPWLFGVAQRTAQEARSREARRRLKERQGAAMSGAEPIPEETALDLREIVDEELSRLPERYRAPLVLCELEGRSRRESAALLGVPEGTISSRLARARAMLRDRLRRRGLALSGGAVASLLSHEAAAAVLPAALEELTVRAAVQIAAGSTAAVVVSAPVGALIEGVLKGMLITKLKLVVLVALFAGIAATGVGVVAQQAAGGPGGAPSPEVRRQPDDASVSNADRLRNLEKKLDRVLNALESRVVRQEVHLVRTAPPGGGGGTTVAAEPIRPVGTPPVGVPVPRANGPAFPGMAGDVVFRREPPNGGHPGDFESRLRGVEQRLADILGRLERLEGSGPAARIGDEN